MIDYYFHCLSELPSQEVNEAFQQICKQSPNLSRHAQRLIDGLIDLDRRLADEVGAHSQTLSELQDWVDGVNSNSQTPSDGQEN